MEKKTDFLTMRIEPSVKASLRVLANKAGVSMGEFVNYLIVLQTKKEE